MCIGSRVDYGTGSGIGGCVNNFFSNDVAKQRGVRLGDVLVFIGSQNVFTMDHADVVELFDKLAERLKSNRGDAEQNVLTFARVVYFDAITSVTKESIPDCFSERNRNHPDVHLPTPASTSANCRLQLPSRCIRMMMARPWHAGL